MASWALNWCIKNTQIYELDRSIISDTTGQIGWVEQPRLAGPHLEIWPLKKLLASTTIRPVWIFKKTEDYNAQRVSEILGSVDLSQVTVMNPLEATQAPNGLLLSAEEQAVQQANGTLTTFSP